jgi:membrane associated rhomboid family serine protease
MHIEQWIVALSLLGGVLFGLAAVFFPVRRLHLAVSGAVLLLLSLYEIRMDRWEKTVRAPIRLDMFVEIPLMILFLLFGTWQLFVCSKRKEL